MIERGKATAGQAGHLEITYWGLLGLLLVLLVGLASGLAWAGEKSSAGILFQARAEFYAGNPDAASARLERLNVRGLNAAEAGDLAFLEGEIIWSRGDRDSAYPKYAAAAAAPIEPFFKSEALWKMAETEKARGEDEAALSHLRASATLLPDNRVRLLQAAYLLIALGRDAEAGDYFRRAFRGESQDDYDPEAILNAAYAAKRAGDNARALKYFESFIDNQTGLPRSALGREATERLYGVRREHADMVRRFGAYAGLYYVRTEGDYAFQGLADLYWQPWYYNGRRFQVFGQAIDTLASKTGPAGGRTFLGAAGVRLKPLSDYDLIFTLEQQFKGGDRTRGDTRGKIGYSWDQGLELEPWVDSWSYASLFAEYVRSFVQGGDLFYGQARYGRSLRPGGQDGRLVVSPHVIASWNYDSEAPREWIWRAGPGLHFRYWYREDKYEAPQSYWDLFLDYRVGLSGPSGDALMVTIFNSF